MSSSRKYTGRLFQRRGPAGGSKASVAKCVVLGFWNTVNFVGFSVIHVSQGSVATYVRYCGMSTVLYSKFPAESDDERILKIG